MVKNACLVPSGHGLQNFGSQMIACECFELMVKIFGLRYVRSLVAHLRFVHFFDMTLVNAKLS